MSIVSIFLVIIFTVFGKTAGQVTGDCYLPNIDFNLPFFFNEDVEDTTSGILVRIPGAQNIKRILYVRDDIDYMTVEYDDVSKQIIFSTLPAFNKFEDEVRNEPGVTYGFMLSLAFECTTDMQRWVFFQTILDTNNHDPGFSKPEYVFKVPMPFPPMQLTLINPIYAMDVDYSQVYLNFTVVTPGFDTKYTIEYDKPVDSLNKNHSVILKNTEFILASETFVIEVTDGERTDQATVRIEMDNNP